MRTEHERACGLCGNPLHTDEDRYFGWHDDCERKRRPTAGERIGNALVIGSLVVLCGLALVGSIVVVTTFFAVIGGTR